MRARSTCPPHQCLCPGLESLQTSLASNSPDAPLRGNPMGKLCAPPPLLFILKSGPHFRVPCQNVPAPDFMAQDCPSAPAIGAGRASTRRPSLGYLQPPGVGWAEVGGMRGLRAQVPTLERTTRDEPCPRFQWSPNPPHPGGGRSSRGRHRAHNARSPLPGVSEVAGLSAHPHKCCCDWRKVPG